MTWQDGGGMAAMIDREVAAFDQAQARPWTEADYQRVRTAALELVRSHWSLDMPDRSILSAVDGKALWRLIGALGREGSRS